MKASEEVDLITLAHQRYMSLRTLESLILPRLCENLCKIKRLYLKVVDKVHIVECPLLISQLDQLLHS